MDIITGQRDNYYWLETDSDKLKLSDIIDNFSELLIGKHLAVISFDGDSFVPTEEEIKRGWIYKNEIAFYNPLTEEELSRPVFDNNYDQWYLFKDKTEIDQAEIFVIYGGFTLQEKANINERQDHNTIMKNDQERFWREIISLKPHSFILHGDNFIFGTKRKEEFEKILNNNRG